jgi:hypothetical protein
MTLQHARTVVTCSAVFQLTSAPLLGHAAAAEEMLEVAARHFQLGSRELPAASQPNRPPIS